MALYTITSGDRSNPLGEVSEDRLKEFGRWLTGTWQQVQRVRKESEEWGRTFKDPEHMRTVNAYHALSGIVLSWGNSKQPRANGTDPQREFQIAVIGRVMGAYGALARAKQGPADEDTITRLTTDYNTAVTVLARYANISGPGLGMAERTELIRAAGEDQKKLIMAGLTR